MNKKTLTIGLLSAMLAGSMLFASFASAFWPFDGWFQKGEVKAVTTDISRQNTRITQIARSLKVMKTACDQLYGVSISEGAEEVQQVVTSKGNVAEIQIAKLSDEDVKKMGGSFVVETGTWREDNKGAGELKSIEAGLKARCNQIQSLYTRLMKLYTQEKPTPTVTPTKRPTMTKKPTSTPSPKTGCYYQQVKCIKAPCEKILVCPTPYVGRPKVQNQR